MKTLEQPVSQKMSTVVAIYDTHSEAETAIRDLQKMGFDMTKLSIVGKDYHTDEDVVGYYTTGDRMKSWGKSGAFWGGFWSLLFGSGVFLIPGIGPLLVAGPIVALDRRGAGKRAVDRRHRRVGRGFVQRWHSQRTASSCMRHKSRPANSSLSPMMCRAKRTGP